jgi:hypothetical protein
MSEAFLERRREARVPMNGSHTVDLPTALTVRLVDISTAGVLLSSPQKLRVGQKARLRTMLGTDPLNADIEVRRVADTGSESGVEIGAPGGFRIGAVFTGMDAASSRSVRHFLSGDVQ